MRVTLEEKMVQYRIIYELLYQNPRIYATDISSVLKIDRNTVRNRMYEAFNEGFVSKPQARRRAHREFREFVYFLECKNPHDTFSDYIEDRTIPYHAKMAGFANMMVISNVELQSDYTVFEGSRSDFHMSFAPDQPWERTIERIREKIEVFDESHYQPKGIIKTHTEEIKWDSEDEILFRAFKYDLRIPFTPIRKKHLISSGKIYEWFNNLPQTCTIFTLYYPKAVSQYDPYLFMLETDYEDFIIDLFSEFPTTTTFFKVDSKLFVYAHVERQYVRIFDFCKPKELQIPIIMQNLIDKGIVRNEKHAIIECYWRKEI